MKNIKLLNVLLSCHSLEMKTRTYHWNVTGKNFLSLHALFDEQYKQLAEYQDAIAERIRTLGEKVFLNHAQIGEMSTISKHIESGNGMMIVKDLHKSNQELISLMREALHEYDERDDVVTADLITQQLSGLEKSTWLLSSILEDDAKS